MSLHGLLDAVVKDTALAEAVSAAADGNRMHVDLVGPPAARPFAIAALARETGRPVLAVTATGREAEDLAAALRSLLPPEGIVEYPSWETLPHERLSPRSDTVGRRLAVLRRLSHPRPDDPETGPVSVVVAPVRSVLQPQVKGLGDLEPVALRTGQGADLEEVVQALAAAAYARVELVEKRGEFAVRGGILDVFPPTEEHPLRVEFWGDDVEEIRYFKVADQRSLEVAEHGLWAPPCRELLLTQDVRERAAALAEDHPELGELLGKIAEGIAVEGMESLAPVLVDDMELLLDVLPKGSMSLVCDPERVRTRAADLVATSQEFLQASWAATAGGGEAPIDVDAASLWSLADVFGVEHKEQLKKLRANVDVLTMSATPIPRTLEMAVTGIREMSTITTPPEERHPVLTFVGPYEHKQIGAAIRRELLREGQVFYIHNRVESIDRAAAKLREIVPEARIATAHGQMSEQALEQVVVDFWEKKFDVLVSTTIVESGIDISNANTLIVERGDNFGLSQLHQLRGRVGRGRERGYAYFLYPPEKPLTETAHERLATIAQHTEMGAGMYVAMKDLEIRGAGNLLGGEQSGHIAGVGFDLYVRMVGEAVADYRASLEGGVEEEPPLEVKIELPVDAHVPHDYAPGERLRLQAYRSIASANSEADIKAVREELVDRYGKLPEPVENLLLVAGLRMLARACAVGDIVLQGNNIRFAPVELRESQELRLKRLYPGSVIKSGTHQVLVPRPKTAKVGGKPLVGRELLGWVGEFLTSILGS
ncbi:Transcription-repair-coupling factor [Streptomyces tendae]